MENFKRTSLYKQSRLRNKVDKMNKAEMWALERKIKVINKESEYFNAMLIRKKKDIELKLKEIQKNSGHSIMSLQPTAHDRHIKESPLFNTGIILSEKQFQSWRLKEKVLEERYKIKELERLQELDRQKSLIQILKDLNIISDKIEVYAGEDENENNQIQTESDAKIQRYPSIYKQMVNKENENMKLQRPVTVDCASIRKHYINTTTKMTPFTDICQQLSDDNISLLNMSSMFAGRSKSASTVKSTGFKKELFSIPTKMISPETPLVPKQKPVSVKPKPFIRRHKMKEEKVEIPVPIAEEDKTQYFPSGFAQMPRWKRQLMMEAPIGLNDTISKAKIHIIMSQAQKRRDLENLIENNIADVEKLAKEKAEEQKRKLENMQATLREMDQMEQAKQDVVE